MIEEDEGEEGEEEEDRRRSEEKNEAEFRIEFKNNARLFCAVGERVFLTVHP
jgi:hypothetical protein